METNVKQTIKNQSALKYAAIHIERPYDNPFGTIPGAYHTLFDFMSENERSGTRG